MRRIVYLIVISLLVVTGGWAAWHSSRVQSWLSDRQKSNLPPAENFNQNANQNLNTNGNVNSENTNSAVEPLPDEKNLAVPFTTQAPSANWDQDHEEFCEEASVAMAGRYFQNRTFKDVNDKESALQQIKQWEIDNLGFYYDTTAAETSKIIEGLYGLHTVLDENPTVEDIKSALAAGDVVIVPAAGRELGNPNFTAPGPIYHNFVIRGYTKDGKFITNDPGTRKGEEYIYDQDVVMNAIHDWVPLGERTQPRSGDVANGRKVVIIVSPS